MTKTVAIIQARMTSTRLPGKVLMEAAGMPLLAHQVERLRRIPLLDEIMIATTSNATDDPVYDLAVRLGVGCHRGSEHDVLSRMLGAAQESGADMVVRFTGDCPLIDPEISNSVIKAHLESDADYTANVLERSYPIGMDTEVFTFSALSRANDEATTEIEREHVTPYIHGNPEIFKLQNVRAPEEVRDPHLRLTLDTIEDYDFISKVFKALYPVKKDFTLGDVLSLLDADPTLRKINESVEHNWFNNPPR